MQDFGHEALLLETSTDSDMAGTNALIGNGNSETRAWPDRTPPAASAYFGKTTTNVVNGFAPLIVGSTQRRKMPFLSASIPILHTVESTRISGQAQSEAFTEELVNYHPQPHRTSTAVLPVTGKTTSRLSLNMYAFWRDEGSQGLAPLAQYGGSQLGLVASYRLGNTTKAPALFARASGALDIFQSAEAAAGVRWQPTRKIPISLAVERRFRHESDDAVAAYLFGGWSSDQLPVGAELSVYGQAGIVRADRGPKKIDHFYDGQVRLERRVLNAGKVHLTVGGGAWAGGQSGVNRTDAGPTAAVNFGLGQTSFRLSADYRFRMAGNATPPSGPAITLSASY
jgi:hypothetical protein